VSLRSNRSNLSLESDSKLILIARAVG